MIASSQGGVNIEDVAAENPDAIVYEPIDIATGMFKLGVILWGGFFFFQTGLTREQAEKVARSVGLEYELEKTIDLLTRLYDLALKKDALLIEVNPYAEDVNGGCKFLASVWGFASNSLQFSAWMLNSGSMIMPISDRRIFLICGIGLRRI